jgi:uncharacterized protein YktB (UPF0637 family)
LNEKGSRIASKIFMLMETLTKNSNSKERRQELITISKAVKPFVGDKFDSVNDAIKVMVYDNAELNTFKGWLEKGYCVRKGERAKVLWGSPKPFKQKEALENEEKETQYFPVCYVFSIDQVELIDSSK